MENFNDKVKSEYESRKKNIPEASNPVESPEPTAAPEAPANFSSEMAHGTVSTLNSQDSNSVSAKPC